MIRGTKLYALVAFSALAFTVLIALGLWQLERREWKRTLLADLERAVSSSAPALALDAAEPLLKDRDYIRVKLRGRFDHAQERYLFAVLEGQTGAQVLTPFITDDRRLVVVNRGFVPDRLKDPRTRPQSLIEGKTELVGLLRGTPEAGMFTPANQPSRNVWYWPDVGALMASLSDVAALKPVDGIVQALSSGPGPWPKPVPPDPSAIPENHLQYALTWFALAAALLVMTFMLLRSGSLRQG
jgi:surfeit locus 1 family protein